MTQLAFVTLSGDGSSLTPASLAAAWNRLWPSEEALPALSGEGGPLVFPFMGGMATVTLMPGPYPWEDLEGPASTAWRWPEAVEVLKAHRTHVLVGILREEEPSVGQSIKLTLLTAAVVAATDEATGVYWAEGTTVVPAPEFVASAREMTPENFPMLSWVEFRVFTDSGRWNLFTTGMQALGLMEIEVRDSQRAPEDIFDLVLNVSRYLAVSGPLLEDGHTIGEDENERIVVRHVDSGWERPGNVIALAY